MAKSSLQGHASYTLHPPACNPRSGRPSVVEAISCRSSSLRRGNLRLEQCRPSHCLLQVVVTVKSRQTASRHMRARQALFVKAMGEADEDSGKKLEVRPSRCSSPLAQLLQALSREQAVSRSQLVRRTHTSLEDASCVSHCRAE